MLQIIAMGGGGFSMEPDNLALDRYIVRQADFERPKVCFLPQASGEARDYILNFYKAFTSLDCRPSWLSLFQPQTADLEGFLMEQHIIYVGGGNTKSMLALWREWNLDVILRKAGENGTVLAGISAGANCWFEYSNTDSIPGQWISLPGLGYLKGSCSPHYDGEAERRPTFQRMVATGEIPPGLAFDDGAAGHFVNSELKGVVSSRPKASAYRVERIGEQAKEAVLDTRYLLES
jgi:peptidase E